MNEKDMSTKGTGWTKLLLLAGISTTLGLSLPVGYNIGVLNTPAEVIKIFCQEAILQRYGTYPNQLDFIWSSIVSIFLVGATIGSLGGSFLADKIGRKGVLIWSFLLGALSAVAFVSSKPLLSIELVFLGRLLVGLSTGLTTSVVPMYLTELAPIHLRGTTGVLCPLGVTSGVLAGQVISMQDLLGNEAYWPYCVAAYVIPLFICSLSLPILPESPKYLYIIKNQHNEALKQLRKLRNTDENSLSTEIEEIKKEQINNEKDTEASWNMGKVLSDHTLLLPVLLVCFLQAGQQLSGINAVFFYSSKIFKIAGLSVRASELATIGAGFVNWFMSIVALWTMSVLNRRLCILVSTAAASVFLTLLGICLFFIDSFPWVPYLSIVGVIGFVLCHSLGLGPIPYFIGSELFEVGPRPSAMSLGSISNWGGNLVVGLLFPTMQSSIGPASFFLFAAITLGLCVFLRFYLPETRGRDISEIVELCNQGLSSKPLQSQLNDNQIYEKKNQFI